VPGTQTNVRKRSELAFDTQKKRQNYTNPLSGSLHGLRGTPMVLLADWDVLI